MRRISGNTKGHVRSVSSKYFSFVIVLRHTLIECGMKSRKTAKKKKDLSTGV